jgi:ABC-2 type transport system ATP-binding protein
VLRYRPSRARVGELLDAVRAAGLTIVDLATSEADLEELFLRLTGQHGGADAAGAAHGRIADDARRL